MHRLAVAEAVTGSPPPTSTGCARPTPASPPRSTAHDTEAALAADDAFHAVAVDATPTAPWPRCSTSSAPSCVASSDCASPARRADSVALHDRLVAACEAGDADAAADVAFRTWQNLADLIPDTDPTQQETP